MSGLRNLSIVPHAQGALEWARYVLAPAVPSQNYRSSYLFDYFQCSGIRLLLTKTRAAALNQPKKVVKEARAMIKEVWYFNEWVLWELGNPPEATINYKQIAKKITENTINEVMGIGFAVWYVAPKDDAKEDLLLCQMWQKVFGTSGIPLKKSERKNSCAQAYTMLKPYIEYHEEAESKDKLDEDESIF